MKETISVLGVELKYVSTEDAEALTEEYLNNDVLNTLCVVTKEMLVYAGEHPKYREILEDMDLHVVVDKDIFTAAGIVEERLLKKADDRQIWNLFISDVAREKKSCFLLAQTEEETVVLKECLLEECPDLIIAGTYAAQRSPGEPEAIVNEINGILPDVVISSMTQPDQELFIFSQRKKLGVKVWFALPPVDSYIRAVGDSWLSRLIGKTVFNRRVQMYNSMQEEALEQDEEESGESKE